MNEIIINGYRRITKREAFKRYKEGKTIYFCPVNLRPGNLWHWEVAVRNNSPRKWESIVNEFEYYNCINSETGRYAAFYVREWS